MEWRYPGTGTRERRAPRPLESAATTNGFSLGVLEPLLEGVAVRDNRGLEQRGVSIFGSLASSQRRQHSIERLEAA